MIGLPKSRALIAKTGKRKRTDTEIARDRALIAELHYKGHNDTEITKIINDRPGVDYELSRRQITYDRNQMLKQWQQKAEDNMDQWVAESMMQISAVQRQAWEAWERSVQEHEKEQIEEVWDAELGEMRLDKVKKYIVQGLGKKAYLDTILECIKEKNRLRGLYEVKLRVDHRTTHEHVIKAYHSFDPGMWDDPNVEVIEGEVTKIEDGQD